MKKFKILIILCIITITSFGQKKLNVEVSNPEPRINEFTELKFDLGMIDSTFNAKLDSNLVDPNPFYGKFLEKSLSFNSIGMRKIGPFNFELNGVNYVSDTIFINVIDSLPKEEGIWLRFVNNNMNEKSIILEQIISSKYKIERSIEFGVRNTTKQIDKNAFNTLVMHPTQEIYLSNRGYMYYQSPPYERKKNKKALFYSRQIYKFDGDFKGILEIRNDFFTKNPKNLKTRSLIIE
jgi:hypothetical protein